MRARAAILAGISVVLVTGACRGGTNNGAEPSPTPTVSPSPSAKPTPRLAGTYVVIANDCLRIRSEPSLNAQFSVCVPPGDAVRADGASKKADGYTWYHVTYKKTTGWMASKFLARKTEP
jgi:hypothetical protein